MASETSSGLKWLPLEANPDVMNKFVRRMGLLESNNIMYTDVFGLDPELLAMVPQPVLATLLLYPVTEAEENFRRQQNEQLASGALKQPSEPLFHMRQTISNACGTIGLVHSLGNNQANIQLEPGSFLDRFFREAKGKTRDEIGRMMETADDLSVAHEEAANEGQTKPPQPDEEVALHFVCFVVKDGHLYELDGRKDGPVDHGPASNETILQDTAEVVKKFVERNPTEMNFALVALSRAE